MKTSSKKTSSKTLAHNAAIAAAEVNAAALIAAETAAVQMPIAHTVAAEVVAPVIPSAPESKPRRNRPLAQRESRVHVTARAIDKIVATQLAKVARMTAVWSKSSEECAIAAAEIDGAMLKLAAAAKILSAVEKDVSRGSTTPSHFVPTIGATVVITEKAKAIYADILEAAELHGTFMVVAVTPKHLIIIKSATGLRAMVKSSQLAAK